MRGLPSSWDLTAATLYSETYPYDAIWSPCNRVIASVGPGSVVILDGATLSRLYTFEIPSQYAGEHLWPSFSPDGHCLTLITRGELISWDLQTGGPLGAIPSGLERDSEVFESTYYSEDGKVVGTTYSVKGFVTEVFSSTYSEDGKVVAAAYSAKDPNATDLDTFNTYDTSIRTYDLSGTEAGRHCAPKGRIIPPIWTHGKYIRFVTINPGSVAVSEVEFTLKNPPVEVESLPIADKIVDGKRFLFLPSLSRLAFTLGDTIQVWDAKVAKLLLESELPSFTYRTNLPIGSFSSNGCFFAHVDMNGVARVWKESPAGYVLHQKLQFFIAIASLFLPNISIIEPRLSPSGESVIMSPEREAFHLWHTRDQASSLPSIPTSYVGGKSFTLAFSPDERFAALARKGGNVVTIFDPLTGDLRLAVDTDMGVVCLGMTESALIVVGGEKIVTWDLPGGDRAFNANINDNVRPTILHHSQGEFTHMSISPDFSRIAVLIFMPNYGQPDLQIYDMSTGRCLTSLQVYLVSWVGFTWDGREVWTTSQGWKIAEDSGSGLIRLEPRGITMRPPGVFYPSGVFPWESRRGYEVTADGWVLSATQKRLLWLPHRWRSGREHTAWSGRFLGLLHKELSEVVILEFPE